MRSVRFSIAFSTSISNVLCAGRSGPSYSRAYSELPGVQERGRVIDILRWAMHETCWDILHHLPHWTQQGVDHHRRYNSTENLELLENSWLQPESLTLEEMYEPSSKAQVVWLSPELNGDDELQSSE
jgi:hypothetical protein